MRRSTLGRAIPAFVICVVVLPRLDSAEPTGAADVQPPTFEEFKKLFASDADAGDAFGKRVAVSRDTAIIGAYLEGESLNHGAAYIFERTLGGPENWGEARKLTVSLKRPGDDEFFGDAVAISADTAIVGARRRNVVGDDEGTAHVYQRNEGGLNNWGEVRELLASDAVSSDVFGSAVAVSGSTAMVGAPLKDVTGQSSGAAYLFERNNGGADNWGEVRRFIASDTAQGDSFGHSIAMFGDLAVVGATRNDDAGPGSGAAYVFERNKGGAGNWGEVRRLTPSDGFANEFGVEVAISGDVAVIGASRDDERASTAGAAYVFERNAGGPDRWGQIRKLTAWDAEEKDFFGASVAVSGDTVVVGAPGNDDVPFESGSVYVFKRDFGGANNWGEARKITASDAASKDWFGAAVTIWGKTVIVGSRNNVTTGAAYIFHEIACAVASGPVSFLLATRTGADDVRFTWLADPAFTEYNLWYVTDKADIEQARLGGAPAQAVVGCSVPNPARGSECTDLGAIPRQSPTLFFYQVRVACDATTEGP